MNISVCYKISRFVQNKRYLLDEKMKKLGLCRTEWRVMSNFNYLEAPVTQKKLLKALDIDAAHLARTLEKLENEHYIIRKPIPENKRSLYVTLTKEGTILLEKIQKIIEWENALVFSDFTEKERLAFEAALNKMEKNIEI